MPTVEQMLDERKKMRKLDLAICDLVNAHKKLMMRVLSDEPGVTHGEQLVRMWWSWGVSNEFFAQYFTAATETKTLDEASKVIQIWAEQLRSEGVVPDDDPF